MAGIGVDIMGGDYAPQVVLEGCQQALKSLSGDTQLYLFGPSELIEDYFQSVHNPDSRIQVVHAPEFIGMHEQPVKALQQKRESSILIGLKHLAEGKIASFASAGHSGALMVAAMHTLGTVQGIDRPCAATSFPQRSEHPHLLLDVGINNEVKPDQLLQFALLGRIYSRLIYGIANPRVGLLNTGSEPGKGNTLYQNAYKLLESSGAINFIGNLEARDFYNGIADVSVCDGFTGNVFLKQAEGMYRLLKDKGVEHPFLDEFNYENYGGTPILGLKGNVVLGHGASSVLAIQNMVLTAEKLAQIDLAANIENLTSKA
jgi:glycerol-3-phosphate acyltransferase PlsX